MLINGDPILRVAAYRDAEKGLVLASNLPVYVLGNFNKHTQEEFITALASDLGNFYSRSDLNPNFACRTGDPRLPNCTTGDAWRPASVLSDAITLLSTTYHTGYRSDGDYDLNNNLGDNTSITAFQKYGFATNNTNVVNAAWYDTSNNDYPFALPTTKNSSYLNNLVTPIQRRINDTNNLKAEYLMEVCGKLPVSACDSLTLATDWWVTLPGDAIYPAGIKASDAANSLGLTFDITKHKAGTTAVPPDPSYLSYPRRVAFLRGTVANPVTRGKLPTTYTNGELALDSNNIPTIIGIKGVKITSFPLSTFNTSSPSTKANALWFQTADLSTNPFTRTPNINTNPPYFTLTSGTSDQPALSPVLQIKVAFSTSDENSSTQIGPGSQQDSYWLQQAASVGTTFNLVAAGGDTPARPREDNGGLHNFVRLLENWNPTGASSNSYIAKINGSFIQRTRSAYATGPLVAYLNGSSLTPYPINNASGQVPYYQPPNRQWGYDVGLLSQSPDAFSQKLAITPNNKPNEYFREVGRDDTWVQTLLCAKKAIDSTYAVDADQRPTSGCS